MRVKIILGLLVLIAVFACENEADNFTFDFQEEQNFTVFNEYISSNGMLSFSIAEVSDLRCPEGATCIWEGEARVKITVDQNLSDTIELSTYNNEKGTINNYEFELIEVSPYPVIDEKMEQDDYRVTLIVSKIN